MSKPPGENKLFPDDPYANIGSSEDQKKSATIEAAEQELRKEAADKQKKVEAKDKQEENDKDEDKEKDESIISPAAQKIDTKDKQEEKDKDKSITASSTITPQPTAQGLARDTIFGETQTTTPALQLNDGVDPVTRAIREEVISKQMGILQTWFAEKATDEEEKKKIQSYNPQQFSDFLKENKDKKEEAFKDRDVISRLNQAEIAGYKNVNENFKTQFRNLEWDGAATPETRSQEVKNKSGEVIATLTEKTEKAAITIKNEQGEDVKIQSFRSIDFPAKLKGEGPMHVQMAVKDEKGNNIAADKAVYFTAHYDKAGKLTEVSAPMPVKFMGEGDDAIGYIEREGKIYTLPVTQGKYKEMMQEVAINQGMNLDASRFAEPEVQRAQDQVIIQKHEWKKGEISEKQRNERKTEEVLTKEKEVASQTKWKKGVVTDKQRQEQPDQAKSKPHIMAIEAAPEVKREEKKKEDKGIKATEATTTKESKAREKPQIPPKTAYLKANSVKKKESDEIKDPVERADKIRTSLERANSQPALIKKQELGKEVAIGARPRANTVPNKGERRM